MEKKWKRTEVTVEQLISYNEDMKKYFNVNNILILFVYNLDEILFDLFVDTVKKVVKREDFKGQVETFVDRECSRITLL